MSPHLSQLNVALAHRNYFRWNNLWILKLATYTKIEDHYFRFKLATFKIGKDCQMFNNKKLSTQNIKFYWFVMKIKKFSCQFDDTIEVYFLLGINIWGLRSEWVKKIFECSSVQSAFPFFTFQVAYMTLSSSLASLGHMLPLATRQVMWTQVWMLGSAVTLSVSWMNAKMEPLALIWELHTCEHYGVFFMKDCRTTFLFFIIADFVISSS